jgi:GntR family transcriptional regulator
MSSPYPGAQSINRSSPVPLYQQIAALLLRDIRARSAPSRSQPLPSEAELTERYRVSRVTIRRALEELERAGIIYREKGRGSFVRRSRIAGFSIFGSFGAEVSRHGSEADNHLLAVSVVDSLPEVMAHHFGVSDERMADERYVRLKRLRLIDAGPAAIEEAYLPHSAFPGLEMADFNGEQSLYGLLAEVWGITPVWAEALVEATPATEDEAALLQLEPGAPLLVAWRIAITKTDEVVEYVRSAYSGGQFLLNIGRHRVQT